MEITQFSPDRIAVHIYVLHGKKHLGNDHRNFMLQAVCGMTPLWLIDLYVLPLGRTGLQTCHWVRTLILNFWT